MDRTLDCGSSGCGFDPRRAHQTRSGITNTMTERARDIISYEFNLCLTPGSSGDATNKIYLLARCLVRGGQVVNRVGIDYCTALEYRRLRQARKKSLRFKRKEYRVS